MFADDIKIWAAIISIDDCSSLQKDVVEWSEEWLKNARSCTLGTVFQHSTRCRLVLVEIYWK